MSEAVYQLRRAIEDMRKEREGRKLNCIPSPFDARDYKYSNLIASTGHKGASPTPIDYRLNLPPVFDQLNRGSCVACAAAWTVKAIQEISQGDYPAKGLSAAFLYSMCKQQDGIPDQEGTYPRVAMQVLQKTGVCPEIDMPYAALSSLPEPRAPVVPEAAKAAAEKYKIQTYAQLCGPGDKDRSGTINTMRQALKNEGPFLLALLVCENFAPDKNNRLPLPKGHVLGGHAVGIVGDLPDQGAFILRNSWGSSWGENGYALLPYEWVTSRYDLGWYVFEAWTATDIVVPKPASRIEIIPESGFMFVDGQAIVLDQPAVINPVTNRTVLPVRVVAGNMGYLVQAVGGKVILTKPN